MNWNLLWGKWIIEELLHCNISCFCVSPGSRSTPLTVAVARNPEISLHPDQTDAGVAEAKLFYDERAAAYYALGHARATGKPAVLICTSGTAAANYFPAIVEASIEQVPMLLLTADRPPELRDTGANQAIDQIKMFGSYVRWFFEPGCPSAEFSQNALRATIDQAVYKTHHPLSGPVHLNLPFREPFFDSDPDLIDLENTSPKENTDPVSSSETFVQNYIPQKQAPAGLLEKLSENLPERGIMSIGRVPSESLPAVRKLAEIMNWPVFADVTSGLRLGNDCPNRVAYYDILLLDGLPFNQMDVEVIWHIGHPPTSKRWLTFWEKKDVPEMVWIADHSEQQDQSHHFSQRIETDIRVFCEQMTNLISEKNQISASETKRKSDKKHVLNQSNGWKGSWLSADLQVDQTLDQYFGSFEKDDKINEFGFVRNLTRKIPEQHAFFIGNSMPVRAVDMLGCLNGAAIPTALNRGASGIDGQIATACGYANGLQKPVTLLLGDLTALHDLNSFQLIADSSQPVICIVLNNHGGGIFSHLPVSRQTDVFEDFFGTPHSFGFQKIAEMFALDYANPKTVDAFNQDYAEAILKEKSVVIEIITDRNANSKNLKAWQEQIRNQFSNQPSVLEPESS